MENIWDMNDTERQPFKYSHILPNQLNTPLLWREKGHLFGPKAPVGRARKLELIVMNTFNLDSVGLGRRNLRPYLVGTETAKKTLGPILVLGW